MTFLPRRLGSTRAHAQSRRPSDWVVRAVGAAACGSSSGAGGISQQLCALVSACASGTSLSFGSTCEVLTVGGERRLVAPLDSNATCRIGTDGEPSCTGAGTQCTDMTPETCADGVITYCSWGTKMTVDCKSFGLSGCTLGEMLRELVLLGVRVPGG